MSADLFFIVVAGLVGAMLGSFLNVCILRWPRDESVVRPRSHCPGCQRLIAWYDNIPVLSWLLLRGRCRHCGTGISLQYPLVELATGLLWAWMAWRYGPVVESVRAATLGTLLLGIAMTDAHEFIIPHQFTFGGLALGLGLTFIAGPDGVSGAAFGACFGAGLLYFVGFLGRIVLRREAMGGGDVAMLGLIGGFLGWEAVLATVFLGSVVGLLLELSARYLRGPRPADVPPPEPAAPAESAPDVAAAVEASAASRQRDLLLLAATVVAVVAGALLGEGTLWTALGGMLAGLGLAFLSLTVVSFFIRPPEIVEEWVHAAAGIGAVGLPVCLALGWTAGRTLLILGSLLVAGTVILHLLARGMRAGPAHHEPDPLESLTTHDLRQLQYLPFGVSLAIAAALVAFVLGPDRVNAWLSLYR